MSNDEARMRELMRELGYYNQTGPINGSGAMTKKQAKAYVQRTLKTKQLKKCRDIESKIKVAKALYEPKKAPVKSAQPKKKLNEWQKFVKRYKGTGMTMTQLSKQYQLEKKGKGKKLKGSSLVDYYGSSLVDYDL